ncbi:MAG: hypothetical protein GX596_10740, partial [Propionibacterium sp.]|nr:hypothetical protein [Propionibacterium sp.]
WATEGMSDSFWGFIMACVGAFIPAGLMRTGNHAYRARGRLEIPLNSIVDRKFDEHAGQDVVDAVKTEYGALLSDVVYRIENAALFDPAAPTTLTFTELMVRWDNDLARLRPDERAQLAADIRVAFDTARAHAEQVGIAHLPETARARAATAAKSLRLARDEATSPAERSTATEKANEILSSLMLYYLPKVDEVAALMGGRQPKALPGRRTAGGR